MDIIQLYQDHSILYHTEGHKHCRPGWVNIECPFCTGNPGYHLGYNLNGDYFFCWRCGGKQTDKVIAELLKQPYYQVRDIIKEYGVVLSSTKLPKIDIRKKAFKFPSNIGPLSTPHTSYLHRRKFNPDILIDLWDLKATGPISSLDKINYKNRIIIPYKWDGQIVTFDSRSIGIHESDKARYKACPEERELIARKKILYGLQSYWQDTGICVEGPTDVWRLGPLSFAVSGIQYTPTQVRLIAKTFKKVAVIFDSEPQAQLQADLLVADLRFRGVEAFKINVKKDPGSLSTEEAEVLVNQIMK